MRNATSSRQGSTQRGHASTRVRRGSTATPHHSRASYALHANLDGATFLGEARPAPVYRLYSIDDRHPGMFEVAAGRVSVAGELYPVPEAVWRRVEAGEPPNLHRGPVKLGDGREVLGIPLPA